MTHTNTDLNERKIISFCLSIDTPPADRRQITVTSQGSQGKVEIVFLKNEAASQGQRDEGGMRKERRDRRDCASETDKHDSLQPPLLINIDCI